MSDASEFKAYLQGWDDAMACFLESLSWVPDEHLAFVIREAERRRNKEIR